MDQHLFIILMMFWGVIIIALFAFNFWKMGQYKAKAESANKKSIFKIWILSLVTTFITYFIPILLIWLVIYFKKNKETLIDDDKQMLKVIIINLIYSVIVLSAIITIIYLNLIKEY